jgi:HSP20 family molecular chaperone IbpA
MYLHHLTDSREAGERLERFCRWARGERTTRAGAEAIPTTVLRSDGHFVVRMEIPGVEVGDVLVEDDVVIIKLSPQGKRAGGETGRA